MNGTRAVHGRYAGAAPLAVLASAVLFAGLIAAVPAQGQQAVPDEPVGKPAVEQQLWDELASDDTTVFWVYLREEADLAAASGIANRGEQGEFVLERLTSTAEASQADLVRLLDAEGADYEAFWIANTVKVTGDVDLLERITALPEVEHVTADRTYAVPEPMPSAEQPTVDSVEWNIDRINAPNAWEKFGATGEGIVVGTIDTGVEYDHPALVEQYRGNRGDGTFDHNYNWHDPSQICGSPSLEPCDNVGHGTHVSGTVLGDDGGDNRIGVAPGAQWIAAKGCEAGNCTQAALLSSGQFMLAPTDLQGENADPEQRPHVVNNSWGGAADDDPWYQATVEAWVAAGIFPQFSSGNTPAGVAPCGSASNPGNLPDSYATGAFDVDNEIADFSNRGSSAWDEDLVKPNISAPGVDVRSSAPGGGYLADSGTSMASPHVAGAVALLWSAAEPLVRDIDATRDLLDLTAIDVEDLTCGGKPENNNVWGQGRLDVLAAVEEAPRGPTGRLDGTVVDAATDEPIDGATITIAGEESRERMTGDDGGFSTSLPAGEYEVTADAFGYAPQTSLVTIVEDETTTENFPLEPVGSVTVTGQVTDGSGHGWPMYARVDVPGTPASTFTDPMTGVFSLTLPVNDTYEVVAEPVYPGYGDAIETIDVGDSDLMLDLATLVDQCDVAPGYVLGDECEPVDGGLVLGHATDVNTGGGVNDATVTADNGDESGRSFATPDDPANEDGFYWLFSSFTGSQQLTASAANYASVTETVDVAADSTNRADLELPAGQLSVEPTDVDATVRLGRSADRTLTITNTGTAAAEVELAQLPGSFEILGGSRSQNRDEAWSAPSGLVPNEAYDPDSPTTEGRYLENTLPNQTPSARGEILASWPPTGLAQAWGVGFDGDIWLSELDTVTNHEFTPAGSATGESHAAPWVGAWPGDMSMLGDEEMCQVNVGGDNGIYCWDTGSGDVIRSISGSFPWTEISQRGLGYRPDDDTFYIGGWNQDILYQVAGFSHDTPGEVVHTCRFPGMGISGLAWNPTAELLWIATNSATDDIHLVDPDECGVLDSLGHPTPGFNGSGLHMNDDGNLWMVSQANSGAEAAVYLVESGVPNATDVPWLEPSPGTATLAPGNSVTVEVSMDSATTDEGQPGAYSARLLVGHDTPYAVESVGVTMNVAPPNNWGKITGTVTGVDCGGEKHVPFGATVQIDGKDLTVAQRLDADGGYTHWLPVKNNPVELDVRADGYQPERHTAVVNPRREAVVDFTLQRTDEFGYTCGPEDAEFEQADTVLAITGNGTDTIDLPFPFPLYGVTYTQAHICSNGFIEFVGSGTPFPIGCTFPNARIPTSARPDAAIYPYWDPNLLVDAEASIRTEAKGDAPNRRLVIEFRNIGYSDLGDPGQRIDFNIVLHENGDVVTQYRNVADNSRERGDSATIGIEDHTGTVALQYSFDQPVLEVDPEVTSIRYQPPPPAGPEGPELWVTRYDGTGAGDDHAQDVGVSPDGSQVFVTGTSPSEVGGADYTTVAYNADGSELWTARYDGTGSGADNARALEVSPDGSQVFVTGFSSGDSSGDAYATVAYDAATGDELWVARYDGPTGGGNQAYALGASPDGSRVFVTGRSIGEGTSFDYATVAYDAADGSELWTARYDGPVPSFGFDQAFAIGVAPDGARVYVTGQSAGEDSGADYATVAYDAGDGSELWDSRYDGPAGGADVAWALGVSATGVFVTGQSRSASFDNDYATVAYDAGDGSELWDARYDGPVNGRADVARAIGVNLDGSAVFVTGQSAGDGTGNDIATLAYDAADGSEVWDVRYDGPAGGADNAWALGVSPDGSGVYVAGESQGGAGTGADYATVAYDPLHGSELWDTHYDGTGSGPDTARALAVSPDGARVYVSGDSPTAGTSPDYTTVAYHTADLRQ